MVEYAVYAPTNVTKARTMALASEAKGERLGLSGKIFLKSMTL